MAINLSGEPTVQRFAEGGNFTIDLKGGLAHCRVFRNLDLNSAECGELARVKVGLFAQLAAGATHGMLLNVVDAPAVTGPMTQDAVGKMLKPWEEARKPIAVLLGTTPIQKLQFVRLLADAAPTSGKLFFLEASARSWIQGEWTEPSSSRRRPLTRS